MVWARVVGHSFAFWVAALYCGGQSARALHSEKQTASRGRYVEADRRRKQEMGRAEERSMIAVVDRRNGGNAGMT